MNKHFVLLALFLSLWITTAGFAQTAPTDAPLVAPGVQTLVSSMRSAQTVMPMPNVNLPVEFPGEANAWVIRIAFGGGFTGQYRGLVVTSKGSVQCTEEIQCRRTLSGTELQSLGSLLSESTLSKWQQASTASSPILGACNDCLRVWLELRHREPDGTEKLHSITWDDVSKSTLPVEVKQIYETAVSFRR